MTCYNKDNRLELLKVLKSKKTVSELKLLTLGDISICFNTGLDNPGNMFKVPLWHYLTHIDNGPFLYEGVKVWILGKNDTNKHGSFTTISPIIKGLLDNLTGAPEEIKQFTSEMHRNLVNLLNNRTVDEAGYILTDYPCQA